MLSWKPVVLLSTMIVFSAARATAAQTHVTREALVDVNRVVTAFMRDSKEYRGAIAAEEQYKAAVAKTRREIAGFQQERLRAQQAGSAALVQELSDRIREREQYLNDFRRVEGARISSLKDAVLANDAFLSEMLQAVKFVAETEGYSSVKRINDDYLYYLQEVDITDKVIQRMLKSR